jgi:predicted nucleotidyltransferase
MDSPAAPPSAPPGDDSPPFPGDRPELSRSLLSQNLPESLRQHLLPALNTLVQQLQPDGLWLFGSWARGTASRHSDVDLLVMGLEHYRVLDAYEAVLQALEDCRLPLQPLVVTPQLLARLLQAGGQPAQACFLAQQVGEKALKALLAGQDRDLRSHSLSGCPGGRTAGRCLRPRGRRRRCAGRVDVARLGG